MQYTTKGTTKKIALVLLTKPLDLFADQVQIRGSFTMDTKGCML